jgi:hypothetical protein
LRLVRPALAALLAATVPVALASGVHTAQASVVAPTGSATGVNVTADAYVDSAHPSSNYGTGSTLYVDGSPSLMAGYLKFDLAGYAGQSVTSAQLRVHTTSAKAAGSSDTQTIRAVGDDAWAETGLTYANRPAVGSAIGTLSHTVPDTSYTVSLDAAAVQAELGQTMSIAIDQPSSASNGLDLASGQATTSSYRPTLILQLASTSPGTTTTTTGTGEAATTFGWGAPIGGDEFNYTGAPNSTIWSVYNSAGHAGNGVRSPAQVTVNGSALQITGLPDGTTGGMSHRDRGRTYGRWEARMRVDARDPKYHPVLILWPDQGRVSANNCAEMDYSESTTDTSRARFFLHYSCSGAQATASQSIDMTQWHDYAIEWTPTHIIGYLDGQEWFRDEDAAQVPDDPAHQTIQLDWFPDGTATTESWMQVDWVRLYAAP